ncbi:HEAT repeat domain-containing protein [Streptomyces yangpuensis]|uniref:HEAT repeat domain-containing protein n=1 Tax=Streptomyces yangpuensis TaxID=1648182 RepID=UPI003813506E
MEESAADLDGFTVQVGRLLADGGSEAFFTAHGPLGALAASGWAAEHVRHLLESVCGRPEENVPGMSDGGLAVAQGEGWLLTLRTGAPASAEGTLVSAVGHCLIAPVGPIPARVEIYARPVHERADALDGRALTPLGVHAVARGQVLAVDAGRHLAVFEDPNALCPHLLLTGPPVVPYRLAYDRATLCPVQVSSADLRATRLTYAIRFLAATGRPSSVPRLVELSRHEQHQVRWEAIRALHRVDRKAGTARLREAALGDQHPEIRATAATALGQVRAPAPRPVWAR